MFAGYCGIELQETRVFHRDNFCVDLSCSALKPINARPDLKPTFSGFVCFYLTGRLMCDPAPQFFQRLSPAILHLANLPQHLDPHTVAQRDA